MKKYERPVISIMDINCQLLAMSDVGPSPTDCESPEFEDAVSIWD